MMREAQALHERDSECDEQGGRPDYEPFFEHLYHGQTGVLELRTFPKDDTEAARKLANKLREFIPVRAGVLDFERVKYFIDQTEKHGLGAFFGVALRTQSSMTDRKGDAAHCQLLTALFVDADYKHSDEHTTRQLIDKFPLPPSLLVHSGGGIHPYWRLDKPILLQVGGGMKTAKSYLKRLAKSVADVVDESVSEPVRVLRIPGSKNFKKHYGDPRLVRLETANENVYSLGQFDKAIPPEAAPSETRQFSVPENIGQGERHEILYKLLRSQKARGLSLEVALAGCHKLNEDQCRPPIERDELDAYLRRIWNQEDSPDFKRTASGPNDVVMLGGDLTEIVDRAEKALAADPEIYQRGGVLTRPIKIDASAGASTDIRRDAGSTVLIPVKASWLVERMSRELRWFKPSAKGEHRPADPHPTYAHTLLARAEWKTIRSLRGVVTCPTLARDGRIISKSGYDAESRLLVDIKDGSFPPVPEYPSQDDARAALRRLVHPLRKFPFVSEAAKSVALSALLTALIRASLRTAPLHAFDAPTAGTGKSLLAEGAGLLATGLRPPALSQGKSDEEDEKRLATVLFAGDPVIHIDNCERPIQGDFLCTLLSQEIVQARILGLSERRVMQSTALVLVTGNNLVFAGDVCRRSVVCRLDAQEERPDTRVFDFDFHEELSAARAELVVAGLTILRAYHVAGRPVALEPMGSFTDWEWIRGALVWLGCADPADTRGTILDSDPRRDELTAVMDLWDAVFGSSPAEVSEIVARADLLAKEHEAGQRDRAIALREKLTEVACKGKWSSKSVGWWLTRNKDRVIDRRSFTANQASGRKEWRLS